MGGHIQGSERKEQVCRWGHTLHPGGRGGKGSCGTENLTLNLPSPYFPSLPPSPFPVPPPPALQLVTKLLRMGVSASCADYDKRTPLMVAAQEGRVVSG